MRLFLYCIVYVCGLVTYSYGQSTLLEISPNPAEVEAYIDLSQSNDPVELSVTVTNISEKPIAFKWEQSFRDQPFEWRAEVQDKNSHYFSFMLGGFLDNWDVMPIHLEAGESFDLTYFVTPNGRAGTATYIINFVDIETNKELINSLYYYVTVHHEQAQQNIRLKDIKLFPIPARNYFEITPNHLVDKIVIYNSIGQKIKTFFVNENFKFDISSFPDGLYMVELIDQKNNKLTTTRLLKRTPRV